MKKKLMTAIMVFALSFSVLIAEAQCSICTKTAQQLGEKPAKALNLGIIYLAFMPMAILGFIGYQWYKNNRHAD